MTALAPTLQAFFTERLINQRDASPHTIAAYRDTFRLLLAFAHQRTGKQPSALEIEDIDAPLITAFLDHLERDRNNSPRTRNARLAAVHSRQDVDLGTGAHVQTVGKGRKQRATPLTAQTVSVLRTWLHERSGQPEGPLFPTSRGRPISRDAVALLVNRHATIASLSHPTLKTKSLSPHVLRHTAAMNLLHAGVERHRIVVGP